MPEARHIEGQDASASRWFERPLLDTQGIANLQCCNYFKDHVGSTWNAAADLSRGYPPSLVGRVLKLDPSKLKKLLIKRSARTSVRKKPQATFFQLPTGIALPEVGSPLPQIPIGCRLQIERPDGSRLTLTLPSLDLVSISRLCADFLHD